MVDDAQQYRGRQNWYSRLYWFKRLYKNCSERICSDWWFFFELLSKSWTEKLISQQIVVDELRNTINFFSKFWVFLSFTFLVFNIKLLDIFEHLQAVTSDLVIEISPVIAFRVKLLPEYFWLVDFREGFYFVNAELIDLRA